MRLRVLCKSLRCLGIHNPYTLLFESGLDYYLVVSPCWTIFNIS